MKKAAQLYGAFIAGIIAAALVAYWYYVQQLEGGHAWPAPSDQDT